MKRHESPVDLSILGQQLCASTSAFLTRGLARDDVALWPRRRPTEEAFSRPIATQPARNADLGGPRNRGVLDCGANGHPSGSLSSCPLPSRRI